MPILDMITTGERADERRPGTGLNALNSLDC